LELVLVLVLLLEVVNKSIFPVVVYNNTRINNNINNIVKLNKVGFRIFLNPSNDSENFIVVNIPESIIDYR
jgi:hypothetical protein